VKIAFATEDKKILYHDHFGDAQLYIVYDISKDDIHYCGLINNTVKDQDKADIHEHHVHKAKMILSLFENEHINVLVNKAFGKNITRIRKKLLPVVSRVESIDLVLTIIQEHMSIFESVIKEDNESYIIIVDKHKIKIVNKRG
jgi:predicted Fe-Mo cluster-binding NifX family protein